MALSKPMSPVFMDTDPLTPPEPRYRPHFSLNSGNDASTDALAGPEDARRIPTQELKEAVRQAEQARPEHLRLENSSSKMGGGSGRSSRDTVDQLHSEIYSRVEKLSINKMDDSSLKSRDSSYESMPSTDWVDELNLYKDKMPPGLRMGYIDVLILYCEDDREAAEKFQNHLRTEIPIENGPIETLLYDDAEMQAICGSKIQHLAKGVERSTYVFIFMTRNFIEDKWCEFSSESCLMEAITNPVKQWCVVPVYTEKRNSSFRVPMGLNTLKGINYYNNDRFYRNGVARLVGDKISVRKHENEKHKIKQKQWLEEHKRNEILLRENQERVARIEEAKTQHLIDWLYRETQRLIRDGVLPDSIHHSASESEISSGGSSFSHSQSTCSLKPVQSQNPAVASYFQKLLDQQAVYGINERNYSHEQLSIIQQMYGQRSPSTPGSQQQVSPPVMNFYQSPGQPHQGFQGQAHYQGQGHLGQSRGQFPDVTSSANYGQQSNSQVKRSQSQTSTDMGPSTRFQLRTEQGEVDVKVPIQLYERIKDYPNEEQQRFVSSYIEQKAEAEQKLHEQQQQLQGPSARQSGFPFSSVPQQGQYFSSRASESVQQANMSNIGQGLPNWDAMNSSMSERLNSNRSSHFSHESSESYQSRGLSSSLSNQGVRQGLGSNTDGNRSHPDGGLLPHLSLLNTDGQPSHVSTHVTGEKCLKQTEAHKDSQNDMDSDHSDLESEIGENRKSNQGRVVHIHIYQPQVVQVGDKNTVHKQTSVDSTSSSDGEETVKEQRSEVKCAKTDDKSVKEKHELKMDIKSGMETHGEMAEQPSSSGANSSCIVDAAPSANPLSTVSQTEPSTGEKKVGIKMENLQAIKNMDDDTVTVEKAEEVLPDDVHKQIKNNFESSNDNSENISQGSSVKSTRFDESVNLNSSINEEKSSSLKRKEIPCVDVKPVARAKPVAAVHPFSPSAADNFDDNCDNTDPKTLVKSEQTQKKAVETPGGDSEQTFVKEVLPCQRYLPSHETEHMQGGQASVNMNTNTTGSTEDQFLKYMHYPGAFLQRNVRSLAFSTGTPPYQMSSLDSEVNTSGRQEVALGNDPLSRETEEDPATQSFIPQSTQFAPNNDNDLEFDMMNDVESSQSSSFEESGRKVDKNWNRRGHPSNNNKECVIS